MLIGDFNKGALDYYRIFKRYYIQSKISTRSPVKIYNYQMHDLNNYGLMNNYSIEDHWLAKFILSRNYLDKRTLSIFGVNGDKLAIKINRSDFKLFYTIENVHVKLSPWHKYEDLLIFDKRIDLSLGFDYINNKKYLRFPYWLMTMFDPTDTYEIIRQKCKKLNQTNSKMDSQNKFGAFICREDYFGDRAYFLNQIEQIDRISCPGKFRHNDNELKEKFADNKLSYLKQFKFNLCPENSNSMGYVTEKIFDAITSGCIPIYWGSENKPESEILNQDAIFFLTLNGNNEHVLNEIDVLHKSPKLYREFSNQNRLTNEAPEVIYSFFQRLDNKLKDIVC